MTVYVDTMEARVGRMIMCHMIADTTDELLAMADEIGVDRHWLQDPGTCREHFDISKGKRALAIRAGAVEISQAGLGLKLRERRPLVCLRCARPFVKPGGTDTAYADGTDCCCVHPIVVPADLPDVAWEAQVRRAHPYGVHRTKRERLGALRGQPRGDTP